MNTPSLTINGDAISRKDLRDKIACRYLENEMPVGWNASINALLRIINSMPSISPAPSVDAPESGNSKLLEMIDEMWVQTMADDSRIVTYEICQNRLDKILREIARLLAERGDK